MRLRPLLLPLAALALLGCAGSQPPIPEGSPPPLPSAAAAEPAFGQGGTFVVEAKGGSRAEVEARMLREAARRTLREGYERFRLVDSDVEAGRYSAAGPTFGFGLGLGTRIGDRGFVRYGVGPRWGWPGYRWGRRGYGWGEPWPHGRYGFVAYEGAAVVEPLGPEALEGEDVYGAETTLITANRILGGD